MNLRSNPSFKSKYGMQLMKTNALPTYTDIGRHYYFTFSKKKQTLKNVTDLVCEIWYKASLPFIAKINVQQKITCYIDSLVILYKAFNKPIFEIKLTKHFQKFSKLFDISICKCINFDNCNCISKNKVPVKEREFILDQRTSRNMSILHSRTEPTTIQSRIARVNETKLVIHN